MPSWRIWVKYHESATNDAEKTQTILYKKQLLLLRDIQQIQTVVVSNMDSILSKYDH